MRNDDAQVREIAKQVALQKLHEGGGVGIDVVGAGGVETGVARPGNVDHRRHVELDQLFKERIPGAVGQRRCSPMAAGRVGIEIAADEAKLGDAAFELMDGIGNRNSR